MWRNWLLGFVLKKTTRVLRKNCSILSWLKPVWSSMVKARRRRKNIGTFRINCQVGTQERLFSEKILWEMLQLWWSGSQGFRVQETEEI